MEAFYAVMKPNKTTTDWASASENDSNIFKTLCTISTCNIIAFSTTTETFDSSETSLGFHVYVADINTPWHAYKVTSNKFPISVLEWDIIGKYLLVGDFSGNVQIWVQKDFLLSEWTQMYAVNFPGEHILQAVFFHNGKKVQVVSEKRDQPLYLEKFQRVKFSPSVRQFGGVPADGCLIISFTGMLGAFMIPSEPPVSQNPSQFSNQIPHTLPSVTESLGLTRNFSTASDICFGKNGNFLIAVSSGQLKVQCYRVVVEKIGDRLSITSHSLPSFFLSDSDMKDLKIEKLKWISHEDSDSLIVAANHTSGTLIQIWSLIEKTTPIHKLFQANKPEVYKTIDWANQAQYGNTAKMLDICASKLIFGSVPFVIVSLDNFKIHCLHADTLREFAEDSLSIAWSDSPNDQRSKLFCWGPQIAAIDVTWMGQMMIQIDTKGQLYAYKLLFSTQDHSCHQGSSLYHEIHILTLLEFCLITGYDYIDILLNLKISYLENLVERLTENFNRQPASVQQYYYVNFLTMKTNLYRLSMSGQTKAHDLTNLLMLHSILITFKSLLRPSDLTCHDKGPAESLAMVLSESAPDVDKVLFNLEPKDFTVEPSTLQSLQQLIQWVADLALNILAKLPDSRCLGVQSMKNSGYDISKDIVALNSIRELLVMIRIWGLLKPQCLPVFSRSADSLDILSTLFRILTRLTISPNDPDEILLDECCMLPSQVLIPQLQSPVINPRTGLMSPVLQFNSPPLKFTFGIEPESLRFCPELPIVEGGLSCNNISDSIRYIQLGKQPKSIRKCSRCGACSSVSSIARTAALRAWEQRWGNRCWCGGFWGLKNLSSQI